MSPASFIYIIVVKHQQLVDGHKNFISKENSLTWRKSDLHFEDLDKNSSLIETKKPNIELFAMLVII